MADQADNPSRDHSPGGWGGVDDPMAGLPLGARPMVAPPDPGRARPRTAGGVDALTDEEVAAPPDPGHAPPSTATGVDPFTDEEVAALLAALDGSIMGESGATERSTARARGLGRRWPAVAALALTLTVAAALPLVVVAGLRSARSPSQSRRTPTPWLTYSPGQLPRVAPLSANRPSRSLMSATVGRRTGPAARSTRGRDIGRSRPRAARTRPQSGPGRGGAASSRPPVRQTQADSTQAPPPIPSARAAPHVQAPERRSSPGVVAAARGPGPRPATATATARQFGFER